MKINKIFKIISSILFGGGIGLCIGIASKNVLVGIFVGVGLSICFAVSMSTKKNK